MPQNNPWQWTQVQMLVTHKMYRYRYALSKLTEDGKVTTMLNDKKATVT